MTSPIVVVTGAGAGVGRATATSFAQGGCDLALLFRDEARLEAAATGLRLFGVRVLPIPTDVAGGTIAVRIARRPNR